MFTGSSSYHVIKRVTVVFKNSLKTPLFGTPCINNFVPDNFRFVFSWSFLARHNKYDNCVNWLSAGRRARGMRRGPQYVNSVNFRYKRIKLTFLLRFEFIFMSVRMQLCPNHGIMGMHFGFRGWTVSKKSLKVLWISFMMSSEFFSKFVLNVLWIRDDLIICVLD